MSFFGLTLATAIGAIAFAGGTMALVFGLGLTFITEELQGLVIGAFFALWIMVLTAPLALVLSAAMTAIDRRAGGAPSWSYLLLGGVTGLTVSVVFFWDMFWAPVAGPVIGLAAGIGAIKGKEWL